jgi:hypothetical protein
VSEVPSPGSGEVEFAALPADQIREFFVTLGKALRAFQLYDENNPVYQRFVQAFIGAFRDLWEELDALHVVVEENRLLVEDQVVYENATRSESLAFLLYKDGLRTLTFRPGIEGEAKTFLAVLNQARLARAEGDDLVTLLWEADLEYLRYRHVDLLAEGLEIPEPGPGGTQADFQAVLEEEAPTEEELAEGGQAAEEAASQTLNREDFNPTLYNLDAREMESLQAAIAEEMARDVREAVIAALFDRLEEPLPNRQTEIISILNLLIPALLSRGELAAATRVLSELRAIESQGGVLGEDHRRDVAALLDRLSNEETLGELVQALEDGAISPSPELLGGFFGHLRAGALGTLIRASETTKSRELKPILRKAVAGIAQRNREALINFLDSRDPVVVTGALHLAGQMGVREVAPRLTGLLSHGSPQVRTAAAETILQLKATTLASHLLDTLLDPEVAVRVAAARVLQAMRSRGAAGRLKDILQSKEIRTADLSEQIAMFEAYGSVEDPQAVPFLDKYLNGKGFLGRREPAEIRACAALALGKVGSGEARSSLREAATDDDPVVRNAVGRAMRAMQDGPR